MKHSVSFSLKLLLSIISHIFYCFYAAKPKVRKIKDCMRHITTMAPCIKFRQLETREIAEKKGNYIYIQGNDG